MKCHVCDEEIDTFGSKTPTEAVVDHFESKHWE